MASLRKARSLAGFSLVEMLITLVIASIAMYGVMQLSTVGMKAQKGITDASDLNEVGYLLQQLLRPEDSCASVLRGLQLSVAASQVNVVQTPASFTEINYPKENPAFPGAGQPRLLPDPANKLISSVSTEAKNKWKGWKVSRLGVLLGSSAPLSVSPHLYAIQVVAEFDKATPGQSLGASSGTRQAASLVVSTSAPDGSGIVTVNGCQSSGLSFKARTVVLQGTVYQAPSDGIVNFSARLDGNHGALPLQLMVGNTNPPTTLVAEQWMQNAGYYPSSASITFPIRKGEFYQVLCQGQATGCTGTFLLGTARGFFTPLGE